ncbi:hypothetical protein ACEPAF_9993 [Sanghuangporus sanghuang]
MTLSARSSVEPIDPSQVSSLVSGKFVDQYFQIGVVSVLVYDAIITMDKEVNATFFRPSSFLNEICEPQAKHFWKRPRNEVDFVYFAIRYVAIFGSVTHLLCYFSSWTRNIANWATVLLIDYILIIRVLVLYSRNKVMSICLKTLLALQAAFKLGFVIYAGIAELIAVGGLAKDVTICGTDATISSLWGIVDWVVPMVYGVILVILALYRAADYWRMSFGFKGFALVKVLIQDQVMYFMIVIACSIFNIMEFKLQFSNLFLSNLFNALGNPAFLSVLGSRMLINLKEAGERGQNQGTSYRMSSSTVSEMEFA